MGSSNIKELTALVALILDGIGIVVDAEKDGKIDVADLPLLIKLLPDLGPAFSNVGAVPAELASLSSEDAAALVGSIVAKLSISDAHAQLVINASLKAAAAVYGLILALKTAPSAAV